MVRSYGTLSFIFAVLFLSVCFGQSSTAAAESTPVEKLVTVLPDDVVAFVATSGADNLKPAFEKAFLGRIWNDQGVQTFYQSIKKELLAKAEQQISDANGAEIANTVEGFIRPVLTRPIVVGVARNNSAAGFQAYGFIMVDAGPRKAEIASALVKLESLADEGEIVEINIGSKTMHGPSDAGDVPGYWGWVGNYLVFAINDGEGLAMKYLQGQRTGPAPTYLRNVPGSGDALAVYVDCERTFNIFSAILSMEGAGEELSVIETVVRELGLDEIKSITVRVGFAGPDLVVDKLLEVPPPRTGILANIKPIDLKMFDMVGAGAMRSTALNCSMTGMYDTLMKAVKGVAGEEYVEIEQAIAAMEVQMNCKIREGLLESLAGPMVLYVLPGGVMMQSPQSGMVAIADLKDVQLWETTLGALGKFVSEVSEGMVQVSSQVQDGRTVHTWAITPLAIMQIMPSWTIVGDKVVIASSPMACGSAVKQITSGGESIRSTEGFRRVTAGLPDNLVCFRYVDSKAQFNQLMMGVQQFWPMVTMGAMNAGLKLPAVLPNLSHIAEDMGTSCGYVWFDADGLRSHSQGPGTR